MNTEKIPLENQNDLSCTGAVISRLNWIDAEKTRPLAGEEIIFIDAVGLFKGTFNAIRSGVVFVEGNNKDVIEWDDIYQWILYPNEVQ